MKRELDFKKDEVFYANTHANFLNQVFGSNYKAWMSCVWNYDRNSIVWMVRFNREIQGWTNVFVSPTEFKEENLQGAPYWGKNRIEELLAKKRIVFEIIETPSSRKYIFRGIYEYVKEDSLPGYVHYYKLV